MYGYVKIGACSPQLKVASPKYNAEQIITMMRLAKEKDVQIILFPELGITGYSCGDLFMQTALLDSAIGALKQIANVTAELNIAAVVGVPLVFEDKLYDCAAFCSGGKVMGIVPKQNLPNYKEFYEKRWFGSGEGIYCESLKIDGLGTIPFGTDIIFSCGALNVGIEICEDLWSVVPPSCTLAQNGANLILNPSASNEIIGKHAYRRSLISSQSGRCICAYAYAGASAFESTTDVVFGGYCAIAENGNMLSENERFAFSSSLAVADIDIELLKNDRLKNTTFTSCTGAQKIEFTISDYNSCSFLRHVDRLPFVPADETFRSQNCDEIFSIQATALAKRIMHTGLNHAVIAISGGLDSTLALLATAKALDICNIDRKNIIALTMPGFGTTDRTYNNALSLMRNIGATMREINIAESCLLHFKDIGHDPTVHNVTYENVQARERTQILMDIANEIGGLVIGTGDLSEMALGWSTYNGDHMSMYAVNCSIPKTLVRFIIEWYAYSEDGHNLKETLLSILDTPISPELLPPDDEGKIQQKTEDIVGPYELHDFFLYHFIRYNESPDKILFLAKQAFSGKYSDDIIKKWLTRFIKRFFSQQFKRTCVPDGPKVGSVSLSPRGDWRMPTDASYECWIDEIEN